MTLPASPNAISISQIQTEYGGADPISFSEYYRAGAYVSGSGSLNIPTAGTISISNFHGTTKYIAGSWATGVDAPVNSGYWTSFTVPSYVGNLLYIYTQAGGGGGGGGTVRWGNAGGYPWNANMSPGGGGGGGNIRRVILSSPIPGEVIGVWVGGGGAGGWARSGGYNSGSDGSSGQGSYITYRGNAMAISGAGYGGGVAYAYADGGYRSPGGSYSNGGPGVNSSNTVVNEIYANGNAGGNGVYYMYTETSGKTTTTYWNPLEGGYGGQGGGGAAFYGVGGKGNCGIGGGRDWGAIRYPTTGGGGAIDGGGGGGGGGAGANVYFSNENDPNSGEFAGCNGANGQSGRVYIAW